MLRSRIGSTLIIELVGRALKRWSVFRQSHCLDIFELELSSDFGVENRLSDAVRHRLDFVLVSVAESEVVLVHGKIVAARTLLAGGEVGPFLDPIDQSLRLVLFVQMAFQDVFYGVLI
jgi:hypothetical protein